MKNKVHKLRAGANYNRNSDRLRGALKEEVKLSCRAKGSRDWEGIEKGGL